MLYVPQDEAARLSRQNSTPKKAEKQPPSVEKKGILNVRRMMRAIG